jgi:hypothetical protein
MNIRRKILPKRIRQDYKKVKKVHFLKICYMLLVSAALLALILFSRNLLTVGGKVSVVFPKSSGDVIVSVFDFTSGEITSIQIPATTEVTASHHLGIWKVGSLWQLGTDEHLGGSLLKDTVAKNFHFPVMYWADSGFGTESHLMLAGKTDMPLKIKLAIALLSFRSKSSNKSDIDLADTSFLVKKVTAGGEKGYSISAFTPDIIVAKFTEATSISEVSGFVKVAIVDETGVGGLAEDVGKVVEMLGAKIVSVKKSSSTASSDCEVYGKPKATCEKIAQVFGCKINLSASNQSADIVVTLGSAFGKRY